MQTRLTFIVIIGWQDQGHQNLITHSPSATIHKIGQHPFFSSRSLFGQKLKHSLRWCDLEKLGQKVGHPS